MGLGAYAEKRRANEFYSGDDRFGASPIKNVTFQLGGDAPPGIRKGERVGFGGRMKSRWRFLGFQNA